MMQLLQEKLPKKTPLRFVIIIPFVTIIVLTVSLIGYIAFVNDQKAVNEAAHQIRNEISARIQEHLRVFLEIPYQVIEFNTVSLQQGWLDLKNEQEMHSYFLEQVKTHDTITSIYFGNTGGGIAGSGREGTKEIFYVYATEELKAGTFNKYTINGLEGAKELQTSIPNFDTRTRPWYIGAKQKEIAGWNSVYVLFTKQDMAISASAPVYDQQRNLLGVISVDIALSQVEKFLQSLEISQSGQSFILESSGLLVATSTGEKLFTEKNGEAERLDARNSRSPIIKNSADFLYEYLGGNFNVKHEKQLEFTIDNKNYFLTVSPIRDSYGIDWLTVIVIPESDFTADLAATNRSTALISLLALSISIAVSIFVSQKIANRVSYLNESVRAFANDQGKSIEISNSRISEIDELTLSFIEMKQQLHQTLQDLKKEANESARAEEKTRESEEQLKAVIDGSQLGFSDWNIKTGKIRRNERWAGMLGYTLKEIEADYLQWKNLLHLDDITHAQRCLQDHLDGKTPIHRNEYRMRTKEGGYRWILDQGTIVEYDAENHPTRMTATHTDITERKYAEEALRASNERFRSLFEDSPIAIWEEDFSLVKIEFDRLRRSGVKDFGAYWREHQDDLRALAGLIQIVEINQASLKVLQAETKEQITKNISDSFTEESLKVFENEMTALANGQTHFKSEIPAQTLRGEPIILELTLNVQRGYENSLGRVLASFLDITERKKTEDQLHQLSRAVEYSPVSIIITDVDGNIEYVNPKFTELTGYTLEESQNKTPRILKSGMTPPKVYKELWQTIISGGKWNGDLLNRKKNGAVYWESTSISSITDANGSITHFVAVNEDITDRKESEEKIHLLNTELEELAITDYLTNLYNRRHFMERSTQELKRAKRSKQPLSILMLDIDQFKNINDTYGHETGDFALKQVVDTLRSNLRDIDILGRMGGDEFTALLPNTNIQDAFKLAERVRRDMEQTQFQTQGESFTIAITISIGVAAFTNKTSNIDDILRNADTALYEAKRAGRNRVTEYESN